MFAPLETLIAVYETGQFTAAADELRISQSTVSARIAQLEQETGSLLFERKGKSSVSPTTQGRLLYQTAVRITEEWRNAKENATRASQRKEPFTMLFSHTTARVVMPRTMQAALPRINGFTLCARMMNSDEILEQVGLKKAQLGVIEKPMMNDSVRRTTLATDQLVLAGGSGPEQDRIWLVRERGSGVRYYTDLYFKTTSIIPAHMIEVGGNDAIVNLLGSGFGTSIISKATVPHGVPYIDIGPEFIRRFYAVTPRSGLSHAQQEMAQHLIDAMTD